MNVRLLTDPITTRAREICDSIFLYTFESFLKTVHELLTQSGVFFSGVSAWIHQLSETRFGQWLLAADGVGRNGYKEITV